MFPKYEIWTTELSNTAPASPIKFGSVTVNNTACQLINFGVCKVILSYLGMRMSKRKVKGLSDIFLILNYHKDHIWIIEICCVLLSNLYL